MPAYAVWTEKRKRALATLLKVGVALLALFVMFRWFEHRQVYFPFARLDADGTELGRPREEVDLTTRDGLRLHGWFFPAAPASPRADKVILISHGNAGNISHRLDLYRLLLELGVNVLAFDYRGYGRSQGRPTEEGTYLDAEAAHDWLRARGFAAENILALGESLGGAVAAELALRRPLGGLILQSTFTSVPDVGKEIFPFLPVRWLTTIRYDTLGKLPRIRVPVLVMHSRSDTIIRPRHGDRLFAAANEPKLFWEIYGDHNDPPGLDGSRYAGGIERFLQLIESKRTAASASQPPGPSGSR